MEGSHSSSYVTPLMVKAVSEVTPRFGHSSKFAQILSVDRSEREDYKRGVKSFAGFVFVSFLIWVLILVRILLKRSHIFKRLKEVSTTREKARAELEETTVTEESRISGDAENTTVPSRNSERKPTREERKKARRIARRRASQQRNIISCCGVVLFILSIVLLTSGIGSVRKATAIMKQSIMDSQEIISDSSTITTSLFRAWEKVNQTRESISSEFLDLCPAHKNSSAPDINLEEISTFMKNKLFFFDELISQNVSEVEHNLIGAQDIIDKTKKGMIYVERNTWVMSIFILELLMVVSLVIVSTIFAWKRRSSLKFNNALSTVLLPLLVLTITMCFIAMIVSAVWAVLNTDACTSGKGPGTPDSTAMEILSERNINSESALYRIVESYIGGCKTSGPKEYLDPLESELQTSIETIWSYLSEIDSHGLDKLEESCDADLEEFLLGTRVLARNLDTVLDGITHSKVVTRCDKVNTIYVRAVHKSICTQMANSGALFFFVFLFISLFGGIIFRLRRALYVKIRPPARKGGGAKVTGAGCFVNEHEEYLEYISRYKHEWEEYRGFDDSTLFDHTSNGFGTDRCDSFDDYDDEEYFEEEPGWMQESIDREERRECEGILTIDVNPTFLMDSRHNDEAVQTKNAFSFDAFEIDTHIQSS